MAQPRLEFSDSLKACGIDWLTCTKHGRDSLREFTAISEDIASAEIRKGNFLKPWAGLGYQGFKCGPFACGSRPDGFLFRVSGGSANNYWRRLVQYCDNVSRIDLQVTIHTREDVHGLLEQGLRGFQGFKPKYGRKPEVTEHRNSRQGFTVVSGCRSSLTICRGYDKGAESRDREYENCLRLETQFNGRRAMFNSRYLAMSPSGIEPICSGVLRTFSDRGWPLRPEWSSWHLLMVPNMSGILSRANDRDRSLKWLRDQVRPSVQRLRGMGLTREVIEALSLDDVC